MEKIDVAIIGGGLTGLTAASRLHEAGVRFTLFERGSFLGGHVRTVEREGFLMEAGADSFLSEKPHALALIRRLGLESEVIPTSARFRKSFVVSKGRLRAVPDGFYLMAPALILPFFRSPILSWRGKLRMGLDAVIPPRLESGDESVGSFVRRRFGQEALDRIGQPMVGGIYSGDPERLSMESVLPKFKRWEAEHGSVIRGMRADGRRKHAECASGARYGLFLSLREGMGQLVRKISQGLPPDAVRFNQEVASLERVRESGLWRIRSADGSCVEAGSVVLALPAHRAAVLLAPLSADLAARLASVPYESVATVHLAYERRAVRHRLNGFGFVVPRVENRSIIGCSFPSVKFEGRAPEGHVLLRAFAGGAFGKNALDASDEGLVAGVRRDLEELLGIRGKPLFHDLRRFPLSMPQYEIGHAEKIAGIRGEQGHFPGLVLAGNYFGGVGVPDCIREGEDAADRILQSLVVSHKS